jgi:hypothetical protein
LGVPLLPDATAVTTPAVRPVAIATAIGSVGQVAVKLPPPRLRLTAAML